MLNAARTAVTDATPPLLIQGGLGVAVSNHRLARAVAMTGHLGVVSGVAIDLVLARRLQDGDPGREMRNAMARFPVPAIAEQVLQRYFLSAGRRGHPYRGVSMHSHRAKHASQDLLALAAFVEVMLAKRDHHGRIGINLLTKVQMPNLPSLYGAMLAGVDYVLMGAGIPREIPGLLDALAEPALKEQSLVVVGPRGWGGIDVSQDAEARGIGDRVTVTGRVDDADLASLYAGASLVVMPSRAEGFGLPVLEAMALGVPVVTSDDPAMCEVGGGATQIFPVGDSTALSAAIARVLNDVALRAKMVEAGRARAQDFDWLDAARTLWSLYARLAQ